MGLSIGLAMMSLGMILILVGMLLMMLSAILGSGASTRTRVEYGGGVMVGPIPIVFGSSNRMILAASIILAVLVVASLVIMIFLVPSLVHG